MSIKHAFVNPKTPPADPTIVGPNEWNAAHSIGDALTNVSGATMAPGTPVYCPAGGQMNLAKADAVGTATCIGVVIVSTAASSLGTVQEIDSLVLTTAQWDAVTGGSGGLTPGAIYYVSTTTAGQLTTTAPSTVGQFLVPVGIALLATTLRLRVQFPIGL